MKKQNCTFRPRIEALEGRQMMAAGIAASLSSTGVLAIVGTEAHDNIVVRQIDSRISVDGIYGSYSAGQVKGITVDAKGGDDQVRLDSEFFGQQPIVAPAIISGGAGYDVLCGGGGDDLIDAGAGNDYVWGGAGNDALAGGIGDDKIYGAAGNDQIAAGDGNDFVDAGDGASMVSGGLGNDQLFGGSTADQLSGDEGNDILVGKGGDDLLAGGAGEDRIWGEAGLDFILGGAGNDELMGGNDNDVLNGASGIDRLFGELGNDILDGGTEFDYLYGQQGDDFLFDDATGGQRDGGVGQNQLTAGHFNPDELSSVATGGTSIVSASSARNADSLMREIEVQSRLRSPYGYYRGQQFAGPYYISGNYGGAMNNLGLPMQQPLFNFIGNGPEGTNMFGANAPQTFSGTLGLLDAVLGQNASPYAPGVTDPTAYLASWRPLNVSPLPQYNYGSYGGYAPSFYNPTFPPVNPSASLLGGMSPSQLGIGNLYGQPLGGSYNPNAFGPASSFSGPFGFPTFGTATNFWG